MDAHPEDAHDANVHNANVHNANVHNANVHNANVHNELRVNTGISVQAGTIGGSVTLPTLIQRTSIQRTITQRTPWLPIALVVAIVAATTTYLATVAQQPRFEVAIAARQPRVGEPTPSPLPPGTRRATEYVTAVLFGSGQTEDGLVGITVTSAQSLTQKNGSYTVSGGHRGTGGGTASVQAPEVGEPGGVSLGVVVFSLTLPTKTCSAPSVQTGESVLAVEDSGWWTRVTVVHVGHFPPESRDLPVRFLVERGNGTAPTGVRWCG